MTLSLQLVFPDLVPSFEVSDEVTLVLGRVIAELAVVEVVHLLDEALHLLAVSVTKLFFVSAGAAE